MQWTAHQSGVSSTGKQFPRLKRDAPAKVLGAGRKPPGGHLDIEVSGDAGHFERVADRSVFQAGGGGRVFAVLGIYDSIWGASAHGGKLLAIDGTGHLRTIQGVPIQFILDYANEHAASFWDYDNRPTRSNNQNTDG